MAKKIAELGGVHTIFLTHYDNDEHTDAELFAKRFGAKRIVHINEQSRTIKAEKAEHSIEGTEPVEWIPDFRFLIVPRHTTGHMVLLYKEKFLFTGDHLYWDRSTQSLGANREYCFYSWSELIKSMELLTKVKFEWVLPRHGDRIHREETVMKQAMVRLLKQMQLTL
ncbi:hypothetical protein EHS13_31915 [Paenibacillus psychroresistens]|uniref:Metallo-beta-lactamase domain-containing protein n=1 Tax=Paenibacillus psychroresistens TaxID=1778678 RepID=A0A6B8RV42_9BACL|nr:MBL fold metallo-hydrolase [Paenibacillus psychroresistens]QGQ99156.1 hypothetical protein EHS13_31915 [Paenibacillus psychroresistens]